MLRSPPDDISDSRGRRKTAGWGLTKEQARVQLKDDDWGTGRRLSKLDDATIEMVLDYLYPRGFKIVEVDGSPEWLLYHSIDKGVEGSRVRCERCGMESPGTSLCRHGHQTYIIDLTQPGFNTLNEIWSTTYSEGKLFGRLTTDEKDIVWGILRKGLQRMLDQDAEYLRTRGGRTA